jgi:hypothetical protein
MSTPCPATPDGCLCCVCVLRRDPQYGRAFAADDECCDGCHADMAVADWPGSKCPQLRGRPVRHLLIRLREWWNRPTIRLDAMDYRATRRWQ